MMSTARAGRDTGRADDGVFVQPAAAPAVHGAVRAAGARIVDDPTDARAIVWGTMDATGFREACHPGIGWVQLPFAGIERWLRQGLIDDGRVFTAAAGIYGPPVAEHGVALLLAAARRLHESARADDWGERWARAGTPLSEQTVAIVGCGGIGRVLLDMLRPFRARTIAVTRRGLPVEGAGRTVSVEQLPQVWAAADHVVLLAPATDATAGLVGRDELRAMRSSAWLHNLARGSLVDTESLVIALDQGWIAGAALDVTDPEPLPPGHPLWGHPRALITPHVACPPAAMARLYAERVEENTSRWIRHDALLGPVDVANGY